MIKPSPSQVRQAGRLLPALALLALSPWAQAQTEDTFYALGALMAEQVTELAPSEAEMEAMFDGMRDRFSGADPRLDVMGQAPAIQALVTERQQAAVERVRVEGNAYLEAFVADGGSVSDSGLAYRVLEPGEGDAPVASSEVEVHYEGRLIDGTVFDSSYERGVTAEFRLNRVIAGWTEGLQLIGPGGRITLVIPPELGYGDAGSPPRIPGGATLVFDVELLSVNN